MIRSMYTAVTGMKAQQLYIDNISNNLANVNTNGFKKSKMEFHDLLYQAIREPGASTSDSTAQPTGLEVGLGVRSAANQRIFTQGGVVETKNPLDIGIQGEGFFQVLRPDGSVAYTRDGSFKVTADGVIVTSAGFPLEPEIVIPEGAHQVSISSSGQVTAVLEGEAEPEEIGQIELVKFVNPAGLEGLGGNLYAATVACGEPLAGTPGTDIRATAYRARSQGTGTCVVTIMSFPLQ